MADQSPFTLEERIVTSMWIDMNTTVLVIPWILISAKFEERFKKNPPTCKIMSKWEIKLFETGNVKDTFHSRRPVKH